MGLNIVLLTPRRRFIANRAGLGYQVPLGLVLIGGPLLDAGHRVRLVDNDVRGLEDPELAHELAADPPDAVMIGHTGSTAAHPAAMATARTLKRTLPETAIVYGGVYPSYGARSVLLENPWVDIVVRGEGEQSAVEVAEALHDGCLAGVRGITWRNGDEIVENPARPPIADLDRYRPGWELVDWNAYRLFGYSRAAGMQFSRGCPLRCTYCGQWGFWKRWRHRSPENFVGELEVLSKQYGVRYVWLADENFAADREAARQTLDLLARRNLNLSLNVNLTAADVVRDADLLPLYRRAGIDSVIMGIESLDDPTVERIRKNNPADVSRQAMKLLRREGILSFANIIYGLEEETVRTVFRTYRRLLDLDPDIMNTCYLTPHHWTAAGRQARSEEAIQPDLSKFTYRNQVLRTPHLSPRSLFTLVKLSELLFHLRPRALLRLLGGIGSRFGRTLRAYMAAGVRVFPAEILEFLFRTRFVTPGSLDRVPGYPAPEPGNSRARAASYKWR